MADVNINFEIDSKYRDELRELAENNYRSMGAQIRLILENYLDKNR